MTGSPDEIRLVFSYGSEKQKWVDDVAAAFNRSGASSNGKHVTVQSIPKGSGELVDDLLAGRDHAAVRVLEISNKLSLSPKPSPVPLPAWTSSSGSISSSSLPATTWSMISAPNPAPASSSASSLCGTTSPPIPRTPHRSPLCSAHSRPHSPFFRQRLANLDDRDHLLKENESDLSRIEAQVALMRENAAIEVKPAAVDTEIEFASDLHSPDLFGVHGDLVHDLDEARSR